MEKEQKNENVVGEYILEIKYRVFNNPQFLADCYKAYIFNLLKSDVIEIIYNAATDDVYGN